MLNFQQKKKVNPSAFTLDPVQRERAKGQVGRRRYLHLVFLAGVIVVTGSLLLSFMDSLRNALAPVTTKLNQELPLVPMAKPSIAELPALPDAAAIAEQHAGVTEQIANGKVPLWIEQPDAPTMAWVAGMLAKDRATPPLPQRVEARDLMLGHMKVGQNLVVSGLLEDSQSAPIAGADAGYQRLLIKLTDEQYLEALAPESARALLIGDEVVVVGRFIGFAIAPLAEPAVAPPTPSPAGANQAPQAPVPTNVRLPLLIARTAAKPAEQRAIDNPYVMRGEWHLPEDLYQNVDDDLLVVETRPYYYTLGQVLLDRSSPEALKDIGSANAMASAIHREPAKFRGQPFTIRGHVFHAWEDPGVTHDQPFGVSRVVRVIIWSEDWGDWDVNDGGQVKTTRKLILRAFELAVITHQPLPQPGEVLTASGRFLRLRSMEVAPNVERDKRLGIVRQSDRAHTFLFVTNDFTTIPPGAKYDFTLMGILLIIGCVIAGAVLLMLTRRESVKKDAIFDSVRKLRESRQALKVKQRSAAAAAVPDPGASAPVDAPAESATPSASATDSDGEKPTPS